MKFNLPIINKHLWYKVHVTVHFLVQCGLYAMCSSVRLMGRQIWCLLKVKVHVCKVWSYFSMHARYADKGVGECASVFTFVPHAYCARM